MEDLRQWQGRWENFESYIDSSDPEMNEVWRQAQQAVDSMPGKPPMFAEGVRNFWKKVCATEGEGVELPLGEVEIQADQEKRALSISWRDREGRDLGSGIYRWIGTVAPGLEGKENLLFAAENQGAAGLSDIFSPCRLFRQVLPGKAEGCCAISAFSSPPAERFFCGRMVPCKDPCGIQHSVTGMVR